MTRESPTSPPSPATEIDEVWREYKRTRTRTLRNKLIERYLPLVRYISERLLMSLPKSIELEDLQSAGVFGLMDAIDGFDLDRGVKFKTYCTTRIRGSILDELRSQDWVPRLVRLKAHQIAKAEQQLEVELGRSPTAFEMARKLGITLDQYGELREASSARTIYSLSENWDENPDDDSLARIEVIEDRNSVDPAECLSQKDVLHAITRTLSRKEKLIVIMYYYEGLTMREIGDILSLTESRVCQIHSNVMSKLKVQLEKVRLRLLA
ncbi:MAG: FliA/WhiG family RNA polymerase sigma factor [Planctomycetes bacterium]|nr:FliA/WhiG family RNA polymerase sigma factor [Planctomycetota bacterium]